MKHLLLMFLLVCEVSTLSAQNYRAGDTLRVFALSGLKLRQQPRGETIATMPKGEPVVVLNTHSSDKTFAETIDNIPGRWIQVQYRGQQGYAFDAYLSGLPLPKVDLRNEDFEFGNDPKIEAAFRQYVTRFFQPECPRLDYDDCLEGESSHRMRLQRLKGGYTYVEHVGWEWSGAEMIFPDVRPGELRCLLLLLADACALPNIVADVDTFFKSAYTENALQQKVWSGTLIEIDLKKHQTNDGKRWSLYLYGSAY